MPGWPWIHDNSILVDLKIYPKGGNTHLTQINMAELRRLARDSLRIIRTDSMEGHDAQHAQDDLIMVTNRQFRTRGTERPPGSARSYWI